MSTEPSTSESKQSESAEPSTPEPSTPEPSASNEASFGGWFTSIVQSAKETVNKSAGTLESIRRDFSEFKDAVQNDATSMVYSTASMVKNKLNEIGNTVNEIGSLGTDEIEDDETVERSKRTDQIESTNPSEESEETTSDEQSPFNLEAINTWTHLLTDRAKSTINMVKETLVDSIFVNRDFLIDELDEDPYVLKDGQIVPIKNWKQLLHQLQTNADTYCREPSGSPEEFELWLTKFNLINYQKQMEFLLDTIPEIRKLHQDLVPKELSDSDFWHRYYYKVHQLKEEQKRLILNDESTSAPEEVTTNESSSNVNIKYLSEKSPKSESRAESESKSSTEDWEKMTEPEQSVSKETDKSSSDEDRDWVKWE